MIRLKKQQAELEAMKLRYLATEKKEAFQQDKQELEDVKNELNRSVQKSVNVERLTDGRMFAASCCTFYTSEQRISLLEDGERYRCARLFFLRLKKLEEDRLGPASVKNNPAAHCRPANESADDHLSRLFEERDLLLRTGVYTHEDRIIGELNRQIQEAMSGRDDAVGGHGDT